MSEKKDSLLSQWFGRSIERAHSKGYRGFFGYLAFMFKILWVMNIDIVARHCPITVLRESLYRTMGIKLGKGAFVDRDVYFDLVWPELITVGDGSSIALGTLLLCHEYNTENYKVGDVLHELHHTVKPIQIGSNVMIGSKSMILPGVVIGDGCIIGACSTVNKEIPAWSIAVGSPARIVKSIPNKNPETTENKQNS
jgi:acetyltransferase-like isoleucine patch superfamily enzyme